MPHHTDAGECCSTTHLVIHAVVSCQTHCDAQRIEVPNQAVHSPIELQCPFVCRTVLVLHVVACRQVRHHWAFDTCNRLNPNTQCASLRHSESQIQAAQCGGKPSVAKNTNQTLVDAEVPTPASVRQHPWSKCCTWARRWWECRHPS